MGVRKDAHFLYILIQSIYYMGYVYLIEDSTNNVYKIGVTRSNSKKRLQKLQTGNSVPLQIKYLFETEYPFRLESMLHNKYRQYQVLNEWYELPKDIVNRFNEICCKENDIINLMKDNYYFSKNLK